MSKYNQTFINKIIKKIQNRKEISYLSINNKCPNNLIFNLSTLPKLEKLNLSGNNLNYFNWQQINSTKLSLIDLRNNPLNCENCKNAWIKKTKNKKIINGWHFKILFPTIPQFIYSPLSLQKCSFSNCLNETAKFEEKNNLKINLGDQLELKCFFKSNNQNNISSLINLNKIFIWPFNGKEIEKENNLKTKTIYLQKENSVILKINSLNIFHLGPVICRCLHCLIPGIFDFKELRFPVPLNIYIYENEIKGEKKIILRGYPIGPLIYLKIIRKEDNKTNLIEFNENIKDNESNNIYLLFNNSLIIKQENDHSSYFIRYFTISIHECTECKHSQKGGIYDLNFCILNNNNNCKLINNLNIIPPKHLISNNNNNIKNNFKQNTSLSILNIFLSIPPILIIISILSICGRIIWKFKQRIKIREKLKRRTRRGSRNTQRTEETSIPLDTMSRTLSLSNYIQNQLNLPLIPEEELQLNECIGKGAFAEVYIEFGKN
ncbi:Protein kinase domain-containing protein [Meloidogyne graminicola]|uniref:Protein kinase domain-containing protein n=1 Tax=Meloidogyne graminicola TaxID=189291 RepID=A0A8S9ZK96_9BILA|nr:Protein kinase domain-containing protein [Meloidogyne graminicola]